MRQKGLGSTGIHSHGALSGSLSGNACARHEHQLVICNVMTGSRDSNRSEPPGGGREADAESSGEQRDSRRNTNGSRGRTRVMSVRVHAKSNRHRKPCLVEPGGLDRKWVCLLGETSGARAPGGVSRGHRSVDAGRKPEGAKGRRTAETAQCGELGAVVRGVVRNQRGAAYQPLPVGGLAKAGQVDPVRQASRGGEDQPTGEPQTPEPS